jgi:cob(I)alamin adenosyltransferase
MKKQKGLVYVFTGDGKGKTSAALGIVARAVCNKMKVAFVAWYKEESWPISEKELPARINPAGAEGELEMYFMGEGFYKLPTDKATPEEHKKSAKKALKKAKSLLGRVDVLVMDEVVKAIADGLIDEKEVVRVVEKRGKTHVVLTGRGLVTGSGPVSLMKVADLATECRKIKHPFDKGVKAVKGLDF